MKVCQNAGPLDMLHAKRPAPYPGPRCATCQKAFEKASKARSKVRHVERTYNITDEEYEALLAAQGGRCAVCRCGPGRERRFAVDHDHKHCGICAGPQSCGAAESIRGLCCKRCNSTLLGRFGLQTLIRAARYLILPPAPAILLAMRASRSADAGTER